MAANIKTFVEEIANTGTFKTNQFFVKVGFPKLITDTILNTSDWPNFSDNLVYRIQRVTLPSRQMKPIMQKSVFRELRPIPVGYNSFDDLTMQILLSTDLRERKVFLEWQNKIFNEGGVPAYVDTISGTLAVATINEKTETDKIETHMFEGCWPMMIGDIELSAESSEVAMMNVVWQYRNWYIKYQSAKERRELMESYSSGRKSIIGPLVGGVTLEKNA